MPSLATSSLDRHLRARQLYRYYESTTGEEKEDIKARLEAADPGFKLLKDLDWAEQRADAVEDAWLPSWNRKGNIKTWIINNLATWRKQWGTTDQVNEDDGARAKDGGAKAKGGEQLDDDQQTGDGEASTAVTTAVPQQEEEEDEVMQAEQRESRQLSRSRVWPNDLPSSPPSAAGPFRPVGSGSFGLQETSKYHDVNNILRGTLPSGVPSSSSGDASDRDIGASDGERAPSIPPIAAGKTPTMGRKLQEQQSPRTRRMGDLGRGLFSVKPWEMTQATQTTQTTRQGREERKTQEASTEDERRRDVLSIRNKAPTMPGAWNTSLDVGGHDAEASRKEAALGGGGGGWERLDAASSSNRTERPDKATLTEGSEKRMTSQERQDWLNWYRKVFLPQERMKEK